MKSKKNIPKLLDKNMFKHRIKTGQVEQKQIKLGVFFYFLISHMVCDVKVEGSIIKR